MNENFGILFQPPVNMLIKQFAEMCKLTGTRTKYSVPKRKTYNTYGEVDTNYTEPEDVFCIFNEHLDAKTAKKLGWVVEMNTDVTTISVPFDLHDLQIGCRFEIPGAFGDTRLFTVTDMSTIQLYPASVTCKLAPEYEDTLPLSEVERFDNSNFNLLREGD